ncbi:hypothetical protein BMETH_550_0 [methanotrophic bacterial endosymbiont of Bathymodiolus sp.]|nr:hypothetical protein BMETH_550_0 [methanotrophic bacterial endosymbiont of Bathymodiolus sp.]
MLLPAYHRFLLINSKLEPVRPDPLYLDTFCPRQSH